MTIATGQVIIAVTGTAVRFPSSALSNGMIITAYEGNSASVILGNASVTNTLNGSGNGSELQAGGSTSAVVNDTDALYLNGSAGDWVSFIGS